MSAGLFSSPRRAALGDGQHVMPQTLSAANGGSDYHVAFATLIRNEARWLPEWLAYHALPSIGVGHFYLYDDGSSDELRTAIAPHVARGLVTLYSRFDVAMGLDSERRSTNMVVAGDSSEAGSVQCDYRKRHGLFHLWANGTCYISLFFSLQSYMVAHAIEHHGDSATYLGFVDVDVRATARTDNPPPNAPPSSPLPRRSTCCCRRSSSLFPTSWRAWTPLALSVSGSFQCFRKGHHVRVCCSRNPRRAS